MLRNAVERCATRLDSTRLRAPSRNRDRQARSASTACAALWPPRPGDGAAAAGSGAAEQHDVVVGLDAPLLGGSVAASPVGRPRPVEVAVEDVPARHREIALDVLRDLGLDARVAVGIGADAVADRADEVLVEGGDRALDGELLGGRTLRSVEQAGRGVQPEVGQRVRTAVGEVAEDRGVAERVAVDLAGHRRGHLAGRRLGVRRLELACSPHRGAGCRRRRPPGRRRTRARAAGRGGS